jgi:hypothetical protein
MMMIVEQLVEWRLAGETEVLGENLPQCHFVQFSFSLLHISHLSGWRTNGAVTPPQEVNNNSGVYPEGLKTPRKPSARISSVPAIFTASTSTVSVGSLGCCGGLGTQDDPRRQGMRIELRRGDFFVGKCSLGRPQKQIGGCEDRP